MVEARWYTGISSVSGSGDLGSTLGVGEKRFIIFLCLLPSVSLLWFQMLAVLLLAICPINKTQLAFVPDEFQTWCYFSNGIVVYMCSFLNTCSVQWQYLHAVMCAVLKHGGLVIGDWYFEVRMENCNPWERGKNSFFALSQAPKFSKHPSKYKSPMTNPHSF